MQLKLEFNLKSLLNQPLNPMRSLPLRPHCWPCWGAFRLSPVRWEVWLAVCVRTRCIDHNLIEIYCDIISTSHITESIHRDANKANEFPRNEPWSYFIPRDTFLANHILIDWSYPIMFSRGRLVIGHVLITIPSACNHDWSWSNHNWPICDYNSIEIWLKFVTMRL